MSSERRPGDDLSLWRVAISSSLIVALLVPTLIFASLFPLVSDLPKWDAWARVPVWNAYFHRQPVMPLLLRPYNGHNLVLPNILFFALGRLSSWNLRLEAALTYVFAFGSMAAYLWLFRKLDRRMLILGAPIAALIFSILQAESFLSGEAVTGHMQICASTWALAVLIAPGFSQNRFWLALALAAAASISYAMGLAIWPLGLLVLLFRKPLRLSRVGWWLLVGLICVGLEANAAAINKPHGFGFRYSRFLTFHLVLLGRPFVWFPTTPPTVTALLGALFLVLLGALVVIRWRMGRDRRILGICVAIAFLGVGQAAMIAVGRGYVGLVQATASHYVSATYPLAIAAVALAVSIGLLLLEEPRDSVRGRLGVAWLCLALLLPLAQNTSFGAAHLPTLRNWSTVWFRADQDLIAGIATDSQIRESEGEIRLVWAGMRTLSEYSLTAFAGQVRHFPIGNVDRIAGLSPSTEPLYIDSGSAWSVEGWAVDSKTLGGQAREIDLYMDAHLLGVSTLGIARHDVATYFQSDRFRDSGWRIDVAAAEAGPPGMKQFRVVARNQRNVARTLFYRQTIVR
jgi:hypothetical protein